MAGVSSLPGGAILYSTAYGQSSSSEELVYDNIIVDRSDGGTIRRRSTVPTSNLKKTFNIVHSVLTQTQKTAIQTFYATYRDTYFYIKWTPDSLYYAVVFLEQPKYTILGGTFWKAEIKVAEI